jgi:hypothetical protein
MYPHFLEKKEQQQFFLVKESHHVRGLRVKKNLPRKLPKFIIKIS